MEKRGLQFFVWGMLARRLRDWAAVLERQIDGEKRDGLLTSEQTAPEKRPDVSAVPPLLAHALGRAEGPPAHWLARVQQDAPDLLVQMGLAPAPTPPLLEERPVDDVEQSEGGELEPGLPASVEGGSDVYPAKHDPEGGALNDTPPALRRSVSLSSPPASLAADWRVETRSSALPVSAWDTGQTAVTPPRQTNKGPRSVEGRAEAGESNALGESSFVSPPSEGQLERVSRSVARAARSVESGAEAGESNALGESSFVSPSSEGQLERVSRSVARAARSVEGGAEVSASNASDLPSPTFEVPPQRMPRGVARAVRDVEGRAEASEFYEAGEQSFVPEVRDGQPMSRRGVDARTEWGRQGSERLVELPAFQARRTDPWPPLSPAAPFSVMQSSEQARVSPTQFEMNWPALPADVALESQDWQGEWRQRERRQRLDEEQRGNLWNV